MIGRSQYGRVKFVYNNVFVGKVEVLMYALQGIMAIFWVLIICHLFIWSM